MSHNDKIFVSIAALEEPGLIDTIKDCLNKAKKPENIIFGISLQYENEPDLNFINNQSRIIRYPLPDYDNNIGPGIVEIRNAIKKLHKDEEYFLQIDSHTTFDKNWDDVLITDINKFENKTIISKQILQKEIKTNSITEYTLDINKKEGILIGTVSQSDNDVTPIIEKRLIKDSKYFTNIFLSGNFYFTKSRWLYEVPTSNHKYVYEEIVPAIISYCYGYNIVSPLISRQVIYSNTDKKYLEPLDEKWWHVVKVNPEDSTTWLFGRKWIRDDLEVVNEIEKLLFYGKNKYMSIENNIRSIIDFYNEVGLGKEFRQLHAEILGGRHSKDLWVIGYDTKEGMIGYRERKLDAFFKGDE
jgi:hypothetical protein